MTYELLTAKAPCNCVIFSANRGYALTNSRLPIIRFFLDSGWRVVVVTASDSHSAELANLGCVVEPVAFGRGGFNLKADIAAFWRFYQIIGQYQPRLIHNFNAKPVIFGTLAAKVRIVIKIKVVNTITGLGHVFVKGGLLRTIAGLGYRASLSRADATIFQNRDDHGLFLAKRWVAEQKSCVIVGAGVDLGRFSGPATDQRKIEQRVVMLGRLIWQKGASEFAKIASAVKDRVPGSKFLWAGELDLDHPDAVPENWVCEQTSFEYVGVVADVEHFLQTASILLFPSYREGVPRAVMEASACGVPTVAFDVPGVREVVDTGATGILVPFRSLNQMENVVVDILTSPEAWTRLSENCYRYAKSNFDRNVITLQHLQIYKELVDVN